MKKIDKNEKTVKRIFYREPTEQDRKEHGWRTGIFYELEDGTILAENTCQDSCLEPLSKVK